MQLGSNTIWELCRPLRWSAIAALWLTASLAARADVGFYEEFSYPSGNLLPAASIWTQTAAASGPGGPLTVGATSLSYPGLARADGFNRTMIETGPATGAGQEAEALLTSPIAGPDAYMSFLLKVTAAPPNATPSGSVSAVIIAFHDSSGATFFRSAVSILPSPNPGKYKLGVTHFATLDSALETADTELDVGTTYLVVTRSTKVGTATDNNDTCKLYINPVPGNPEPASPTATYVTGAGGGTDTDWPATAVFDGVFIRQRRFAGAYTAQIDAIRAGTTWADVTPAGAANTYDPFLSVAGALSFPTQPIEHLSTATLNLAVLNGGGSQPLHITAGTSVTGANAANFAVLSGAPQTIAAGGVSSGTLAMQFRPGAGINPGLTTATLNIASDSQAGAVAPVVLGIYGTKALPVYEPFDYGPGAVDTGSRYKWNQSSANRKFPITVLDSIVASTESLTYPSMPTTGRRIQVVSTHDENLRLLFSDQINTGNIYASFLLRVTTGTLTATGSSNDSQIFTFNKHLINGNNSNQGELRIRPSAGGAGNGQYRLGLSLTSFANTDVDYAPTEFDVNTTYFVVLRYTIGAGNDTITMYVDPPWADQAQGATSAQVLTHSKHTGSADVEMGATDTINGVNLIEENFSGPYTAEIDEVRVGLSYQDVTNVRQPVQPVNAAGGWTLFN